MACKIINIKERYKKKFDNFIIEWHHFEKHIEHVQTIQDIMWAYGFNGYSLYHPDPYKQAIKEAKVKEVYPAQDQYDANGGYISSNVRNFDKPFLNKKLRLPKINFDPGIVLIKKSGRSNDSSTRYFTENFINQFREFLDNVSYNGPITVLGPQLEILNLKDNVINWTGKTSSILDALAIIDRAKLVISFDGILGYYAAITNKSTIIFYHHYHLLEHYYNLLWFNVFPIIIDCNLLNNFKFFEKKIENFIICQNLST